ncbi:MAG: hypothetical protein ACKVP3_23730 [Hyphomicrobiaceae bacterium]
MDRSDIQELSAADLDKVSGGIRVLGNEVLATEDLRTLVSKVESNRAQKEVIRQAQRALEAMKSA